MTRLTLSLRALLLSLAFALPSHAFDFKVQVSCDFRTFSGSLAPGGDFIVHGIIYPDGTLQTPEDGFNADLTPTYPDDIIGTWTCRGIVRTDNPLHTCESGASLITTALFEFNEKAKTVGNLPGEGHLWTNGVDRCDDVEFSRIVGGGTDSYARISGEHRQAHLGRNSTTGSNFWYDFTPAVVGVAPTPEAAIGPAMVLGLARPNPTGEQMTFDLRSSIPGWYRVDVFDISGRLVRTLFDATLGEEVRTVRWDGNDASGLRVSPGTYFYRANGPQGSVTQKSTVLR